MKWTARDTRPGIVFFQNPEKILPRPLERSLASAMPLPDPERHSRLLATRRSLIEQLPNREDRTSWQEFFDTYWRLIYGVARKSGLNDAEAQDVVQETVIGVSKSIERYRADAGSFKNWLLQLTRWRIIDQVRKRSPANAMDRHHDDSRLTAPIDRIADTSGAPLEAVWEEQWQATLLENALERLKKKVNPKHFQIFDCAVVKRWSARKIADELDVNVAQVYLVKHRLAGLLKKEVAGLEKGNRSG